MGWADDFRWELHRVVVDWRKRRPKQIRDTPPPDFTSHTLRYIRIHACRHEAPTTVECAKWSQTDPFKPNPDMPSFSLYSGKRKGPFLRTSDFVCDKCKHPHVTNAGLISKLGLSETNENFSERTLRRYINAEEPMPVDQFRRAVANAFAHGWLGLWQTLGIASNLDNLTAARRGILAVIRRAMERKSFIQRQVPEVTEEEIHLEVEKQLRLMDHDATRTLNQRLKAGNLTRDHRAFIEELLLSRMDKK
jgi:hypothetical protein